MFAHIWNSESCSVTGLFMTFCMGMEMEVALGLGFKSDKDVPEAKRVWIAMISRVGLADRS